MQQYELLFILPGTITEDEVNPIVSKVKEEVEKVGGTEIEMELGVKTKLAYPMNHIRYGFFELCYFSALPSAIPALNEKLRLMSQILRVVLRKRTAKSMRGLNLSIGTVTQENVMVGKDHHREAPTMVAASAAEPTAAAPVASSEPVAPTETKAENIKIDDIDEKLNKLLNTDIAGV